MKTRKTLLTALILGAMTVPSVFAYDDIDGVNYNIKDPNIGTYVERQPDGTTTSKLVLRKELMGVEGIRLVADNDPASSFRDSGYIGGSSVIMKTVDKSTTDTMEYARMESGSVDLVRHENGQDVYTTRVSYGGFTNTNHENKKIDIMHGTISISDYSNDAHDHDITLGLEHGLYQGDMTERNGSRLTKDKLTISKANGEEEYDDYGNDITKKFTADYDLNGMTVANEYGNIKFTTSGINAGNQKIEGVAAGVAETDAVNVKQLNDKIGALKDNDTITNVTAGPNITVVESATPGQNGMPASPTFNVSLTPDVAINSANFSNTDTNIETDITATGILVNDPNGSLASMNNQGFNVHEGTKYGAMQNDHIHFGDTSKSESADYSLKGIYLADNDSNPINITKENISFGDRQLHDVKAGTADTDAVNVKQLKDTIANIKDNDTITTVVAGDNIAVTNNGHDYTVSLDQATKDKINAIDGLNGRVGKNADAIQANKDAIRDLQVGLTAAGTDVVGKGPIKVRRSMVLNGGSTFEVSLDQATTDQIKANKDGIDGLNAKVADNTKAIANNADAIKENKGNISLNKAAIDELANRVVNGTNTLNNRINTVEKQSRRGVASASALAALHPLDYNPDHKLDIMAGLGHYRGNTAVALGAAYRPNENVMFSAGVSINGKDTAVNAGVSYKVGAKESTYRSQAAMAKDIEDLKAMVNQLHEENGDLKAVIYNMQGK
nr:MAG TPA: YadA-like membrane anchor domain protein [Myoviridae sp. ctNPX13]